MEEQDKTTFSLEDDPNDEIIEEEVVDRDEEYDDEGDYDDDYDDYDEEEEYDDEENYDDGYNDDYYDDRLNKVLDEIAEIKRGMSPAAVQQLPPQYVYQPSAPPAGSEVVMYNEISRLRDELAKNQSNLEMQKELTRLKDDMARDQKFAESQYNAEIKRLQDKIDDLLKNGSSPLGELPAPQASARLEGGKELDFEKLLSINEAILYAAKESDARIQGELAQVKKQLEGLPAAGELNRAVSAIKKAASNADNTDSGAMSKLSEDIAALRLAINEKGVSVPSTSGAVAKGGDVSASEILRQLYDIKNALGNSSAATAKRTQVLLDLVTDYKKVNFDVHSQSISLKEKLSSVSEYVKKLAESNEPDAVELIAAANELVSTLAATTLTRSSFAELAAYAQEKGNTSVTSATRDSAERFFGIGEKLVDLSIDEAGDFLPDLVAEKNLIENNGKEAENNELLAAITVGVHAENRDEDDIKGKIAKLASLTVADVIALPFVEMPKTYKPSRALGDDNIFAKLAEIKSAIVDGNPTDEQEPNAELQEVLLGIDDLRTKLESSTGTDNLADALEEIRNNYLDVANKLVEISEMIAASEPTENTQVLTDEDKARALDDLAYIRGKLDEHDAFIGRVDELRADIFNIGSSIDFTEQFNTLVADITSQFDKLYEDLSNVLIESEANIVNRIGDSSVVTDAIENAKTELLAETQAIKDSLFIVTDAVTATSLNDAIEQLRADLSAFSDITATNVDASTLDRQRLLEDVAFLREQAELALSESEQAADTVYSETDADKEKVNAYLDEIASRVGLLGSISEDTATTKDAVNSIIDNMSALLDAVSALNISEDVETLKEGSNAVLDALAPISDQLNAIIDRLDATAAVDKQPVDEYDTVAAASALPEDLEELKEDIHTILDTLPLFPQSDDLITARDNTYSILDTLTMMPQSEDVVVTRDNVAAVLDAVNALADAVNASLDAQAASAENNVGAVGEDIAAIRADTSAILDAMPQGFAEDLAVVRDNTSTVLDSLSTLTQSQEDIAALRETVDGLTAATEDIRYIRQKLDESNSEEEIDDLANLMQDIGLVLDKLEAYEQTAAADKQEIIDTVNGIREEIHINELDETISAAGIDDETRDTLVSEISDIRERLANIESTTQVINDVNSTALDGISAQLAELQAALEAERETEQAQADGAVLRTLDDINEKLTALVGEDGSVGNADIIAELEQIKEYLQSNPETIETLSAGIADIKARLDGGEIRETSDADAPVMTGDIRSIIDELAYIREKLDADPEYDTVEEILSLREDVKAARIVDQNEVSGELESIKNELAAISSGNILDEIRALRDDIAGFTPSVEGTSAPTDGELNLVLNEIVSLRDEVFALKDEVLNATATPEIDGETGEEPVRNDENINIILDEITALRADQSALTGNIDELKDIISRRTSLSADSDSEQDAVAVASNELNVVLDEIINLKNDIERIEASVQSDRLDGIGTQIDEIRASLDELHNAPAQDAETVEPIDVTSLSEQLDNINAALNDLLLNREATEIGESGDGEAIGGTLSERFDLLHAEIDDIKMAIDDIAAPQQDLSAELAELRDEIAALRAENEQLKQDNADAVAVQLAELRDTVRDMALSMTPATTADGDTSYAALIDEIRGLKEQVAQAQQAAPAPAAIDENILQAIRDALETRTETNIPFGEELGEIRDEIAQLRSLTTVAAESGSSAEVAALKDELAELKGMFASPDSLYGVAEDVTAIKADVQQLREEPDLGVMSEILALRDEFQELREQIEDVKRIAGKTDRESDDSILNEVRSLRDQLFAISMANVNDSTSGESNYESYNNLILDEIASLREQVDTAPNVDITPVSDELAQLRSALDKREDLYDALAQRVAKLNNDATNNKILEELASLRTEMANQRDADLTTLNFMSEMAHLLERQNQYLSDNAGSKITDEIESLKAEIASTDAVAEEVAKLREIMTQSGSASDNDTILSELADLREELSSEKPSRENELILDAIARLRDEITLLAEREQRHDAVIEDPDLSDSLSDLKDQLSEIAGIVEPQEKQPAQKKKPAGAGNKSGAKSGTRSSSKSGAKKSGAKSGGTKSAGGAKRGRKPAQKKTDKAATGTPTLTEPAPQEEDFDAKIDEQVKNLGGDGEMSLNPQATTNDTMDVADRLAKQVANKLVMEQLVEQLSDGGVSDERVEEILRDILPQEFKTVAETEESDKVRRLANQLVLNKLRARLSGKNNDSDD